MPLFRDQLRSHYDAQSLSPAKVEEILTTERSVAAGTAITFPRTPRPLARTPQMAAIAAMMVLFLGLAFWLRTPEHRPVSFTALAPAVIDFFHRKPRLPKKSQDPARLREWLIAHGAPPLLQIPTKLQSMRSLGCDVLDVEGRPAYLICFWNVEPGDGEPGELVHLLSARRSDFRNTPDAVKRYAKGNWSFVSWSEGDLVYTLAAQGSGENLKALLALARWRAASIFLPT